MKDYISPKKRKKVIEVWRDMTVAELAQAMGKHIGWASFLSLTIS